MSINLTKLTTDLNAHQNLDNQPSLSASELKQAWDKPVNDIKTYINSTLTEEISSKVGSDIAAAVTETKSYTDTQIGAIDFDAEDIDYDNSVSGMTATNVQAGIDELRSNISSVNSSLTSVTTRVSNLENGSGIIKKNNIVTISNGTTDYQEAIIQNGLIHLFVNVKSSSVTAGTKIQIGTLGSSYRPKSNIKRSVNCYSTAGGGSSWFSDLYINSGGTIQIDNQTVFVGHSYNFDITFSVV